jgi:phosphoglycerol transferase
VWLADQWRRREWLFLLLVAAAGLLLAYTSLELWASRLDVPYTYFGDALPTGAHFKTVRETGWYEFNPLLSAPAGQTYNDFPTADNLHFMAAWVLSLVTPGWAQAMNLYFIIGFPLAAVSAAWLLRRLSISRPVALVLGVLYAIAPYHFIRGESHLWLASYYVIPLALALVYDAIRGEPLWGLRTKGPRWLRWASLPTLRTLAIILITGTAQQYYAVFFLILLAFAGIVRLIRSGQWSRFWGAAIAGVATVVVMAINMGPDIFFSLIHGPNPIGFTRSHVEAEVYALKLVQLLLPWTGHRIGPLRELRTLYDTHYGGVSESPALGAVAAFGFVALFLILAYVAASWGARRTKTLTSTPQFGLLAQSSALLFVTFIFATLGGLSSIISFVTASIRGWNRIAIVMSMICLIAVGILLDALIRALVKKASLGKGGRAFVAIGLSGVVLIAGYIDQTPADMASSYAPAATKFDADQAYFDQLSEQLPKDAMVLQLPYLAFPEGLTATGQLTSEVMIPYLHTEGVRWSGGGIKGRPEADWPGVLETYQPGQIAELAAAAGFDGILVDRSGLTKDVDRVLQLGLLEATTQPLASADGRWAFYPLDTVRADLDAAYSADELEKLGNQVVDPVTVTIEPSFGGSLVDGELVRKSATLEPYLTLASDRDGPTDVQLTLELSSTDGDGVTVSGLGDDTHVAFEDGKATVTLHLVVPPGTHQLQLRVDGPPENNAALQLGRWSIMSDEVAAFLAR